jgi:hypothetical protein
MRQNGRSRVARAALVLVVLGTMAGASWAGEEGVAVVYLADGTSVALLDWQLFYEYQAVPAGASRGLVKPSRRESRELWFGKDVVPLAGRTMEVRYEAVEHEQAEGAETVKVLVPRASLFLITAEGGKVRELKPETPQRERLRAESEKGDMIIPMMVSLSGRSLSGTEREFCLAAFHALVECRPAQSDRVMRVVFPQ